MGIKNYFKVLVISLLFLLSCESIWDKIEYNVSLNNTTYNTSDPILLTVEVKNVGINDITLPYPSDMGNLYFELNIPNGKTLNILPIETFAPIQTRSITLKMNENKTALINLCEVDWSENFSLYEYQDVFKDTGTYTFKIIYEPGKYGRYETQSYFSIVQ